MALSQVYSAIAGDIITAARWNNEFGNIYTNGTDVAFPLTKAVSYAGYTVTYDVAGVSTITSPATTGFLLTIGSKSGTPGPNGNLGTVTASTFTDTATAAAGTASLWTGFSIRTPTLAASAINVTTVEAATLYVEGAPTQGTNETLTAAYAALFGGQVKVNDNVIVAKEDTRTTTVTTPLTVRATTSGTPAAGIGTGILVQAESQDESPSDVGQLDFSFSDQTSSSEDSFFRILLRVAGAALASAYMFVTTSAFQAIFTHANAADRTYSLPDYSTFMDAGFLTKGPTSCGASSTMSHEGSTTISSNQALDGIHFYTNFTLNVSKTVTLDNNSNRLIIFATNTITINGTIDGIAAGSSAGGIGYTQAGGGGGDGAAGTAAAGGSTQQHGVTMSAGGTAGSGSAGGSATTRTGDASNFDVWAMMGGAGGGNGANSLAGAGGRGGGSIVLIAPTIVLGSASALKTSGGAGTAGGSQSGGGGGGGAGNILILCNSFTDNGCTFTLSGGGGGAAGPSGGFAGGSGAAGVRQINIYA